MGGKSRPSDVLLEVGVLVRWCGMQGPILFTKLPLLPCAGHRPSAICAFAGQRVSELPPRDINSLASTCASCVVDERPVGGLMTLYQFVSS